MNFDLYEYLKDWKMETEIEVLSFQKDEVFLILSVEKEHIEWIKRFTNDLIRKLKIKWNKKEI